MLGRCNTVPFKTPSLQFKMLDSGPNLHLHAQHIFTVPRIMIQCLLILFVYRFNKRQKTIENRVLI